VAHKHFNEYGNNVICQRRDFPTIAWHLTQEPFYKWSAVLRTAMLLKIRQILMAIICVGLSACGGTESPDTSSTKTQAQSLQFDPPPAVGQSHGQ
jgi:hypothetical protein